MKMYKYFLIAVIAVLCYSCSKETEGLSKETVPASVELLGDATMLVKMGTDFVDPGCEAYEGDTKITNVTVSGTLNTNVPGRYTLRYTALNSDGVPTIAKRTVIVFDPATPTGFYKVSKDSYRNSPPSAEYKSEPTVLVYQEESGNYYVSDLFGGYYAVGRGYGDAYAVGGSVKINAKGDISLAVSGTTPWGDKFSAVAGKFDSQTQKINLTVSWNAYTFYLILIKQ